MEYHAIRHLFYVVIRPKVDGITDIEWKHGCRVIDTKASSQYQVYLEIEASEQNYKILKDEVWDDYIYSMDDPESIQEPRFIKIHNRFKKIDKWDSLPTIY